MRRWSRWSDPAKQGGHPCDLQRELGLVQPVHGKMALGAKVRVELRIAAIERECGLHRVGQLPPGDLRRSQVDLRRLEVPAGPGQLRAVVQPQVLAARDYGHGIEEPGEDRKSVV